jgi:hypothetical protein
VSNPEIHADLSPEERFRDIGVVVLRTRLQLLSWIANRLVERYGARIHFYVRSERELDGLRHLVNDGPGATLSLCSDPTETAEEPVANAAALVDRARVLEARTGMTFGELSMGTRAFARGFFAGAVFPTRPRYLTETDDLQVLQAHVRSLEFWDAEIAAKRLTLFLEPDQYAAAMCRTHSIPIRVLEPSRYRNLMIWSVNERRHCPQIYRRFQEIDSGPEPDIVAPFASAQAKYDAFWKERGRLAGVLRRTVAGLALGVFYKLRGEKISRTIRIRDRLSNPLRQYVGLRRICRECRVRIDDLDGRAFAYFPMHKEPEISFITRSPECVNQFAVIQSIARDLPAGMVLAVKENLQSTSFRPPEYFRQIVGLKNVVLLDIRENSVEAVKRSSVVVTITGSAGLEGAVLGKPVIAFGRHTTYGFLPHVRTVTNETQLREHLRWAVGPDFDEVAAKRDGARFLEAVRKASFDAGTFRLKQDAGAGATEEAADAAVENLIDSLYRSFTHVPRPIDWTWFE